MAHIALTQMIAKAGVPVRRAATMAVHFTHLAGEGSAAGIVQPGEALERPVFQRAPCGLFLGSRCTMLRINLEMPDAAPAIEPIEDTARALASHEFPAATVLLDMNALLMRVRIALGVR